MGVVTVRLKGAEGRGSGQSSASWRLVNEAVWQCCGADRRLRSHLPWRQEAEERVSDDCLIIYQDFYGGQHDFHWLLHSVQTTAAADCYKLSQRADEKLLPYFLNVPQERGFKGWNRNFATFYLRNSPQNYAYNVCLIVCWPFATVCCPLPLAFWGFNTCVVHAIACVFSNFEQFIDM